MADVQDSLLELIPEPQLQGIRQIRLGGGDAVLPSYAFRRVPEMEELKQLRGLFAICQANQTVILTGRPSGPVGHCLWFSDAGGFRCVHLEHDDRYIGYTSWVHHYFIIGKSDYAIAETAAFLWGIDGGNHSRCIECPDNRFDFGAVSIWQLAILFLRSFNAKIQLTATRISHVQSDFLAQMPFPISLTLMRSFDSFLDGGNLFVELILQRATTFGRLALLEFEERHNITFRRLLHAEAIDMIDVQSIPAQPRFIQQLLSASVNGVSLLVDVVQSLRLNWSDIDILPKKLIVQFSCCESEAHIDFISSFLRRLSELKHTVSLELYLDCTWDTVMPNSMAQELIRAIAANQNLEELRLRVAFSDLKEHLEDVFAAMEYHEGLRYVRLDEYPEQLDPDFSMLKQLLRRNRFIEVFGRCKNIGTNDGDGDDIIRIYAINTFFRDSQSFEQERTSLLSSLLCEALTLCANAHFPRSALLLASHTGILCELVQYSQLLSSMADETDDEEELDGTNDELASDCELDSSLLDSFTMMTMLD